MFHDSLAAACACHFFIFLHHHGKTLISGCYDVLCLDPGRSLLKKYFQAYVIKEGMAMFAAAQGRLLDDEMKFFSPRARL